ncbi:MAG: nucleotide exchange factor GrpE [Patescibacteria group bacterium]
MQDEQQNPIPEAQDTASTPPSTGLPQEDALEQMRKERDDYLQGWQRARADYENAQKQLAQQRDEDRRRVRSNLAEDLLAVVDNFGYVTKYVPDVTECSEEFKKKFDTWYQGIGHIDRQFAEALSGLGVEAIEAVGKPFDVKLHEAASSKHVEGTVEGIVLEELVRGWKLGDVVLRPSKVIVSE